MIKTKWFDNLSSSGSPTGVCVRRFQIKLRPLMNQVPHIFPALLIWIEEILFEISSRKPRVTLSGTTQFRITVCVSPVMSVQGCLYSRHPRRLLDIPGIMKAAHS